MKIFSLTIKTKKQVEKEKKILFEKLKFVAYEVYDRHTGFSKDGKARSKAKFELRKIARDVYFVDNVIN